MVEVDLTSLQTCASFLNLNADLVDNNILVMSLAQSRIAALRRRVLKINEIDIKLEYSQQELQRRRKLFNQQYLIIPASPNRTHPPTSTNPQTHYTTLTGHTFTMNTDFYRQSVFVESQSHLLTEHNVEPAQEIPQAQKMIAEQPQKKQTKAAISDKPTTQILKLFPVPQNDENQPINIQSSTPANIQSSTPANIQSSTPANIQSSTPQAEDSTAKVSNTSTSNVFGLFSNNLASAAGNTLFGAKAPASGFNDLPKQLFLSKSEERAPQQQSPFGTSQFLSFKNPFERILGNNSLPSQQPQFVFKQLQKEQPPAAVQSQSRNGFGQLGSTSVSQKPTVVQLPPSLFSSSPKPTQLQKKQAEPIDLQPKAIQLAKPAYTFQCNSPKLNTYEGTQLPAPRFKVPVYTKRNQQSIDSPAHRNKEDGSERIQIKLDEDEEEEENWEEDDDKDDKEQDQNEQDEQEDEAEQNKEQSQDQKQQLSPRRKPNPTIHEPAKLHLSSQTLQVQPPQQIPTQQIPVSDQNKQVPTLSVQKSESKSNQANVSKPTTSLFNANAPKTTLFSAQPPLSNVFSGFNNKPLAFNSTPTTTAPGGFFGLNAANTSTSGGLFGTNPPPAATSTSGGLFGVNPTPANNPAPGIFGINSAPPTPNKPPGFFGTNTAANSTPATTSAPGGLFGVSSQMPGLFGQPLSKVSDKQFSQTYLQKATGFFGGGQTNSLFNPSGSVFSSQAPMFNTPGNLFSGQTSLFNSAPSNPPEHKDEEDESGEGDDDGPIEAEQTFNPELSTGKYDYIQTNILFKEAINKFRRGKGEVLQNITASLQKFADNPTLYLFIRLANKVIGFSGRFLEKASQIRVLNNSPKNIQIGKILECGQNVANPELCLLRLQFKDEQSGQKFKQEVQKVLKPSASS